MGYGQMPCAHLAGSQTQCFGLPAMQIPPLYDPSTCEAPRPAPFCVGEPLCFEEEDGSHIRFEDRSLSGHEDAAPMTPWEFSTPTVHSGLVEDLQRPTTPHVDIRLKPPQSQSAPLL